MSKPEEYQEMVERVAYSMLRSQVRGESLLNVAHVAVQQAILWHMNHKDSEAKAAKASRKRK